jgi:hypothetical protein
VSIALWSCSLFDIALQVFAQSGREYERLHLIFALYYVFFDITHIIELWRNLILADPRQR